MKGVRCQKCGGFGRLEPGGYVCINCGHAPIYRWIVPRSHQSETEILPDVPDKCDCRPAPDERNRIRQWAVDQMMLEPANSRYIIQRMLEKLEAIGS